MPKKSTIWQDFFKKQTPNNNNSPVNACNDICTICHTSQCTGKTNEHLWTSELECYSGDILPREGNGTVKLAATTTNSKYNQTTQRQKLEKQGEEVGGQLLDFLQLYNKMEWSLPALHCKLDSCRIVASLGFSLQKALSLLGYMQFL